MPQVQRRARGYLMVEVLMGGAILALVLGSSIDLIVSARTAASIAAKRQVASELARSKAHELWGSPHVLTSQSIIDVGPGFPGLKWSWVEQQSGLQARSAPVLSSNDTLHEIIVRVTYPSTSGSRVVEFRSLKARR